MPALWEIMVQSVVAFCVLFVFARLMGKRQIAQLTFFDYIAGITIGNMAASWSLDEVKSRTALAALVVWTILAIGLAWIERKSYMARVALDGKPVPLVEHGKIMEENMKKVQLSVDEFMLLLRQKDVFNLSDVEYAAMENNGTVSIMKKPELQPVTRKDLKILVAPESAPKFLILSGQIIQKNLKELGYTREWLLTELRKQGVDDFSSVFTAQLDSQGNIYIDKYDDMEIQPQPQVKPLLLAALKKDMADLQSYALQTDRPEMQAEYQRLAREMENIIRRMTPYLQSS